MKKPKIDPQRALPDGSSRSQVPTGRPLAVAPAAKAERDTAGTRHGVLPMPPGLPIAITRDPTTGLVLDDAQRAELERLAKEWGAPP